MTRLTLATVAASNTQGDKINHAITAINAWAQTHVIGKWVKVPLAGSIRRRLVGRDARITTAVWIDDDIHVLLRVPRLDGRGDLVDDSLRTYIPLKVFQA